MSSVQRNTTIRDQHRRIIAADKPPCAYRDCLFPGEPIDYDADHLDPRSFVVDHITARARGGSDTLDNKQPMHRACNRDKSDKDVDLLPGGVTFVTERCWWSEGR